MGVDPSRDALQLAILTPQGPVKKRVPFFPTSLQSIDSLLEGNQEVCIGIESAVSCGSLLLLYWLRRGYDLREVNPQISKRLRECLTESHPDLSDALGLAWSVSFHPDLPKVRFTQSTAAGKRLSAVRAQLIKAQTRYLNRLHVLLTESYGPLYKSLFARLKGKGAWIFFWFFPLWMMP